MVCNKCKKSKKCDCFAWRNTKKKIKHKICKQCHRDMRNAYYKENKQKEIDRIYKYREENRIKISEYLERNPCIDCGETDQVVLQFDHVRGNKRNCISVLSKCATWNVVSKEIEKCEVRCANCHARRTAKQFFWKKANK